MMRNLRPALSHSDDHLPHSISRSQRGCCYRVGSSIRVFVLSPFDYTKRLWRSQQCAHRPILRRFVLLCVILLFMLAVFVVYHHFSSPRLLNENELLAASISQLTPAAPASDGGIGITDQTQEFKIDDVQAVVHPAPKENSTTTTEEDKSVQPDIKDKNNNIETHLPVVDDTTTLINPAEVLYKELIDLQNPPDCSTAKLFVTTMLDAGAGAHLSLLVNRLAYSHMMNRTMIQNQWHWPYSDCPDYEHTLGCQLLTFSKCHYNNALTQQDKDGGVLWNEKQQADRVVFQQIGPKVSQMYADFNWLISRNTDDVSFIPVKYRSLGRVWYFSQLMGFVMRPSPDFTARLRLQQANISLFDHIQKAPTVGVHIRHGDKTEGAIRIDLPDYVNIVTNLVVSQRNISAEKHVGESDEDTKQRLRKEIPINMFISTDDDSIGNFIRQNPINGNVRYLAYPQSRNILPQQIGQSLAHQMAYKQADVKKTIFIDVLEDLFTIADCKYFVGTFSSNFGCVAWMMQIFNQYRVASYRIPNDLLRSSEAEFAFPKTSEFPEKPFPYASADFQHCNLMGVP